MREPYSLYHVPVKDPDGMLEVDIIIFSTIIILPSASSSLSNIHHDPVHNQVSMGLIITHVVELDFEKSFITLNIEFVLKWQVRLRLKNVFSSLFLYNLRMNLLRLYLEKEEMSNWLMEATSGHQTCTSIT